MMQGFEDVTLRWKGEAYTVPANRVFELVRRLEITIMDGGNVPAFSLLLSNRVPQSTLAVAYAEALRFAGADVKGQDVYLNIMDDFASDAGEAAVKVQSAVVGLLQIISPPLAAELSAPESDGGSDEESDPEKK